MRPYIIIYLFCMLFSLTLFAEEISEEPQQNIEINQESTEIQQKASTPKEEVVKIKQESTVVVEDKSSSSVATLLKEIKTAKAEDRRELMNQLKVELRAMNKKNREETMRELKKSFAKNGQGQHRHQNRQQQLRHQPQYRQLHIGNGRGGGH